jgi:hypothetical protein
MLVEHEVKITVRKKPVLYRISLTMQDAKRHGWICI